MPTTHANREVTLDDAQSTLTKELGPAFQVTRKGYGSPALTVKRNPLIWATVRASSANGGTTFKVSGGGFILGKLLAEIALNRKVTDVLSRSFSGTATS